MTTFLAQSNKAIARASAPAKANNTTPGATTNTTTTDTDAPNANTIDKGKSPEKNAIEGEKEDKPPLTTRLMNKASDFWIGLGREGQKSTFDWKRKTYNAGEKLMDRIEYEEWALKGVDPTLGPTLNLQEVAKKRAEAKQSQAASQNVKDITKIGLSPVAALNVSVFISAWQRQEEEEEEESDYYLLPLITLHHLSFVLFRCLCYFLLLCFLRMDYYLLSLD